MATCRAAIRTTQPYLGRFDPRYLAQYVIEVMGFNDRKYEESKKRTHPRMRRLGPLMKMQGRSSDRGTRASTASARR